MTLGNRIYELRTAKNLSQGDLAEALDVSRQSVSKWETDTSVPDLDKLVKLCDLFGVTMDELVRGGAPKAAEPAAREHTTEIEPHARPKKRSGAQIAVGIVLICLAVLGFVPMLSLLSTNFNGLALPLWFAILIGGIVCLAVRGRVVRWALWSAAFAYCVMEKMWSAFMLTATMRDTPTFSYFMTVYFISIAVMLLILAMTLTLVVKRRQTHETAL